MGFNLEIVSPVKMVFQGEVKSITIPGTMGSFQVLKNHAPFISSFEVGKIKVEREGSEKLIYSTGGGIFEVKNNNAMVLADSIESSEEVDVERARLAKIRAEEILKHENVTIEEKEEAKELLKRSINRIEIAEK